MAASTGFTVAVADYIRASKFEDLPQEVVRVAKDVMLDQLGCQLACSQLPHGRIALDFARVHAGRPEATVIGSDFSTSMEHAALANGILGHGDEIDGSLPGFGHAGAVLVPTLLAVGESTKATGRDLILALVVGYDMARRLARAGLNLDTLAPRNFHQSSVAGSIAAAAAAGKLLDLDQIELRSALGLAAEQACGLMAMRNDTGHMNKSFHFGVAARNGVTSVLMAQLHYGGVMDVFDSPHSVFEAFVPDEAQPDEMAKELGQRYDILEARFKRYAAGSPTHSAIAAMHGIMLDEGVGPAEIETILVRLPTLEHSLLSRRSTIDINIEYIIAVAALDGRVSWEQFEAARQEDPLVQDMLQRVTSVGDLEMDRLKESDPLARPAEVVLRTRRGATFTAGMTYPPGSPKNPLGREELVEKFMYWTTRVISDSQARDLRQVIETLEDVTDVNEIGTLLRIAAPPREAS